MVFVVSGALCGLAAVVLLGRLGAGLPTAAQGMELDAIAAVILGGSSLFGGRGSVFGTLFGALILAVLQNGLNLMGVNSFIIQILSGVIIILAVLLDRFRLGQIEMIGDARWIESWLARLVSTSSLSGQEGACAGAGQRADDGSGRGRGSRCDGRRRDLAQELMGS